MSSHSLLLVDLSQVRYSFSEIYLFLDNHLVIKSPETDNELVAEVCERLALALSLEVPKPVNIGEFALAKACAETRGLLEEYQSSLLENPDNIDSWYEGYAPREVLKAALEATRSESPYPEWVTAQIDAFVYFDFKAPSANSDKHHTEAALFISDIEKKENGFAFSNLTAGFSVFPGIARLCCSKEQLINPETIEVADFFEDSIRYIAPAIFSFQMKTHGCDCEDALQRFAAGLLKHFDPTDRPVFLTPDCARKYRNANLTVYVARNDSTGDIDPHSITIQALTSQPACPQPN